ncbi:hydrolase [Tenacibaculum sp. SZ-18]|uniref:C40 family peptidase n=1 Tax=Tenacibaculum sp. SZ-18 TaxID=754423 RepID=UPI000C2D5042|nr:C40 family peptidase [Tenacibaculum sp. SZ-18]AUC14120.1 hydrolase [Tenacibaculum sp. SZ-18]
MIRRILFLFLIFSFVVSCGSSKKVNGEANKRTINRKGRKTRSNDASTADKIVWTAVTFKGAPYKYGGTNRNGMDCSGLIYTSFKKRNIVIPRTSIQMYSIGYKIPLRSVQRGDLLFFKIAKKRNRVNHVGLVTSVKNNDIKFIHSTSSRGVIVSSLNEPYWKRAFINAKRVLDE